MSAAAPVVAGVFSIPSSHPALPGHFPGRPVVPGVVLLDHALGLLGAVYAGAVLRDTKFFVPVLPDEAIEIRVSPVAAGYDLVCVRGETVVLSARLRR